MSPITPNQNNQEIHKNHIKPLTLPTNTMWGNGVNKIIALVVFIFLLFSTIPVFALQFQPIKEITEFEKEIISNAAKKPAGEALKNAIEFKTSRGLVVLKFQNGDEGYYGYGGKNISSKTAADPEKTTEECILNSLKYDGYDCLPKDSNKTVSDNSSEDAASRAGKVFEEFLKVWNKPLIANELTPEELAEADNLMHTYIGLFSQFPDDKRQDIYSITGSITARGNRYASQFENTISSFVDAKTMADFYDLYIRDAEDSDLRMRNEDRPSEKDKYMALQKLIDYLQNWQEVRPFALFGTTQIFFEKNEPAVLQDLINQGKVRNI